MTNESPLKRTFSGILILGLFLLIFTSCNKKEEPKQQAGRMRGGPTAVDIRVVQPGFLQNVVHTTGTILPNETVELRPEVSGRVTGIFFTEGTFVEKGKLLVKINDAELQAQLKKMEAQEELLTDDEFRQRKLLEIKAISQEVYDAAANQLRVLQAEKQLLLAQIAKTEIYAPFSGKIGLRAISPGSFVVSNTTVANLQQFDPVKIEFTVPEKYSSLVKDGMQIAFDTETSDSTFTGKVYARENSISTDTRTLRVRALAPNRQQLLTPGKFARITLILETFPEAITVPSEAMVADMTSNLVYVCRNRKAVAIQVETGIRTEREIQVTSGLMPGDSLIITGLMQITDGSPVNPNSSLP